MAADQDQTGQIVFTVWALFGGGVVERLADAFVPFVRPIDFVGEHPIIAIDPRSVVGDCDLLVLILTQRFGVVLFVVSRGGVGQEGREERESEQRRSHTRLQHFLDFQHKNTALHGI